MSCKLNKRDCKYHVIWVSGLTPTCSRCQEMYQGFLWVVFECYVHTLGLSFENMYVTIFHNL